jgi:hypothetical protein
MTYKELIKNFRAYLNFLKESDIIVIESGREKESSDDVASNAVSKEKTSRLMDM